MKSIYLQNNNALIVHPALAEKIGFDDSVILLKFDRLVLISNTEETEGKFWFYKSIRELKSDEFPFWSIAKINRIIKRLEEKEYIYVGNFNKHKYDKTRWFSINYDLVSTLPGILVGDAEKGKKKRVFQNETRSNQSETHAAQNETPIPQKTQQNTTQKKDSPPTPKPPVQEKPKKRDPSPEYLMASALSEVCGGVDLKLNRGKMFGAAKRILKAGYTPDQVREYYSPGGVYWSQDWRGQKGELPSIAAINETIGRFAGIASQKPKAQPSIAELRAQMNGVKE